MSDQEKLDLQKKIESLNAVVDSQQKQIAELGSYRQEAHNSRVTLAELRHKLADAESAAEQASHAAASARGDAASYKAQAEAAAEHVAHAKNLAAAIKHFTS